MSGATPLLPYTPLFHGKENITFYKWAVSKQIGLQDKSNTYNNRLFYQLDAQIVYF